MGYVGQRYVYDDVMFLSADNDFRWAVMFEDLDGKPVPMADGSLYFEFDSGQVWPFDIDGARASLRVPAVVAAEIKNRCGWRLAFLPVVGDEVVLAGGSVRFQ